METTDYSLTIICDFDSLTQIAFNALIEACLSLVPIYSEGVSIEGKYYTHGELAKLCEVYMDYNPETLDTTPCIWYNQDLMKVYNLTYYTK